MKRIAIASTLLSLAVLPGCSTVSGWFGESDEVEQTTAILDNQNSEKEWFCYGKQDGSGWQCEDEANQSLIKSVTPKRPTSTRVPLTLPTEDKTPAVSDIKKSSPQAHVPGQQTLIDDIMNRPEDHYAVQIIALQEENGITNYAKRNGIADPKYVKIHSRDEDWYVLLLGIYEDRSSATKAKQEWEKAKSLRAKPWVRLLGPLQEAVRAGNGQ